MEPARHLCLGSEPLGVTNAGTLWPASDGTRIYLALCPGYEPCGEPTALEEVEPGTPLYAEAASLIPVDCLPPDARVYRAEAEPWEEPRLCRRCHPILAQWLGELREIVEGCYDGEAEARVLPDEDDGDAGEVEEERGPRVAPGAGDERRDREPGQHHVG